MKFANQNQSSSEGPRVDLPRVNEDKTKKEVAAPKNEVESIEVKKSYS